jgi:16S rRNA (adenine1518-N6/adenine1519-N6)-dimethyltransferase
MSPRRLGQHFLADAAWRERILSHLRPRRGETWLEIGAGHGEMTRELARRARRVVAVEMDPPLVEALCRLSAELPNLEVAAGDVLQQDIVQLARGETVHVYGSLPYYITSPILRLLFAHAASIESIHVVIQSEVAARLVARPGGRDYGFLSVLAQYYAQPRIALRLPPGAFRPPPRVASALVALPIERDRSRFGVADEDVFFEFVGRCFTQKRKTLLNNLKDFYGARNVEAALRECSLRSDARAEQLSIASFAVLFSKLLTAR